MANDDFTKLIFEVEQQGAARVERSFRNIEGGITSALQEYKKFNVAADQSSDALQKNTTGMRKSLGALEKVIVKTRDKYSGMFTGGKLRRQEKRVREITKEMDKLSKVMASGSEEQKKMARERLEDLKKAADFEAAQTGKVFQEHKKEFDKLVNTEKKSLASLSKEAMGGGLRGINQLRQGNISGFADTVKGGVRKGGEQARKRSFDAEMMGGKGAGKANKKLMKLLKTFGKMAGGIALFVGAAAALVKMFLALDQKIADVNKSMLKNVSLVEMSSSQYSSMGERIADAESAMQDFRDTVMTNADLRMLGMKEEDMASTLQSLNEQGMLLGDLRAQGHDAVDALETAQVAALNLGVDASETASLIGKLADVSSESFEEAKASLTQVISFAHEAGVAPKKLFSVVSDLIPQMGLFNYRIEDTAALFSKLSNVMDAKSAEEFTNSLSTALKDASALERSTTVVVNGLGKVGEMADRTQKRLAKALDTDEMKKAFKKLGQGDIYEELGFEGAMKKLSTDQKNRLQSLVNDMSKAAGTATGEELRKFRGILEANRNSVMEMQGITMDFALGDQIALQIGELEGKLRMPLENMNSVLAESQGVSEAQLRMMKAMKSDLSGDLSRLRAAAEENEDDPESFKKVAESMGYSVELSEVQNGKLDEWTDLLGVMTKDKQDKIIEEQEKQKTHAEKSAEMQRSILDTIKYKLLDFVSGMYKTLLGIYDFLLSTPWGGSDEERARVAAQRREMELKNELNNREKTLDKAKESGDKEKIRTAKLDLEEIEMQLAGKGAKEAQKKVAEAKAIPTVSSVDEYEDVKFAGEQQAKASGKLGGKHFRYEGSPNLENFQGMESADYGKLKSAVHDGKVIKDPVELKKFVEQLSKDGVARTKLEEKLKAEAEKGNITATQQKKILDDTYQTLAKDGIKVDKSTLREWAKTFVDEQRYAEMINELMRVGGYRKDEAQNFVSKYKAGDKDFLAAAKKKGSTGIAMETVMEHYGVQPGSTKQVKPKKGYDAKMVTAGIPFLDLQEGDIIVDQESLATTLAGGKGDYVPDLIRKSAGGKGGGGGAGGGNTMHANFNIYGGDVSKIRESILKVIEEWERKRSTS